MIVVPLRMIAAGALVLCAGTAHADFKADWAKLVAEAEREGSLTVYAQPNLAAREAVQREWSKAYPKIAISLSVVQANQFIARIRTERAADKFLWDVAYTGHPAGYVLGHEGVLDPVRPELIDPAVNKPELWGGWDEAFVDVAGKYVLSTAYFTAGAFYDARHVSPTEVAKKGLAVMLDSEFKGKVSWHDPQFPGSGQSFAYHFRAKFGDDGLRKLVVDQKVAFPAQQQQVVEAIAHGTAWFGVGPHVKGLIEPYQKAGIQADVRTFGNSAGSTFASIGGSNLYVFNKRPHPAATRVFVNWLLGKDVQYVLAKDSEQNSRRRDVPAVDPDTVPLPGVKYESPQREENQGKVQDAVKLVARFRQEAK